MDQQSPNASDVITNDTILHKGFNEYLDQLASNKDLEKHRIEYEKLFNAFKASTEENKRLSKKCEELENKTEATKSLSCSKEIIAQEKDLLKADMAQHYFKLIEMAGEDPSREGILKTPLRAAKALLELTCGYRQDLKELVNDAIYTSDCNEMVIVKDIELYSMCEHHMLPFIGKCHVAYIPQGKVIGLSKIARIVDMFARRMQIQENLTCQIAQTLQDIIGAEGVAVTIEAQHMCMRMRGVGKQNSVMVSSTMLGSLKEDVKKRAEYLALIKLSD
jgi:GTP cyclohydrolase I